MKINLNKIWEKVIHYYQGYKKLVWIITGSLVIIIATLVYFILGSNNMALENVQYVEVIRGSLTESIGDVGIVEAQPSASLTWTSGGIVADYDLEIGDTVSKDEVLLELEFSSWPAASLEAQTSLLTAELELENIMNSDSDYQAALQAVTDAVWTIWKKEQMTDYWNFQDSSDYLVETARTEYMAAEMNVWILEEEYERLRTTLDNDNPELIEALEALEEADLERDIALRALNQILGTPYNIVVETDFIEYDQAKASFEQVRAEYTRLLDKSQEIAVAEANVQALLNTINEAHIIAPFDGTITEISYLPGEFAPSGSMAVQIDDLDNLVVNIDVSEIDIEKMEIGQEVIINFDALPFQQYEGVVSSIASAGENDYSGAVKFHVCVSIIDPDDNIKPGYTASVEVITSNTEDALLIPSQALLGKEGNFRVVVLAEDGTQQLVNVEVGASSNSYTEIISNEIEVGDLIMIELASGEIDEEMMEMRVMMRQMNGGDGGGKSGGGGR